LKEELRYVDKEKERRKSRAFLSGSFVAVQFMIDTWSVDRISRTHLADSIDVHRLSIQQRQSFEVGKVKYRRLRLI